MMKLCRHITVILENIELFKFYKNEYMKDSCFAEPYWQTLRLPSLHRMYKH